MIALRLILVAALLSCSACSLFRKNKSGSARMYEGDSSPVIQMSGEQSPGGPIN